MPEQLEPVTITREELYRQVWKCPAVRLAKQYGISDVALAKACKKHQIPKPPLGHWARIQHGQSIVRPPLPTLVDPQLQVIHITPNPEAQRNRDTTAQIEQKVQEEMLIDKKIVVPSFLDSPHPVVARTERSLRSATPDHAGIMCPKGEGLLDVAIGSGSIERAMRILDTLLKSVEARGMKARPFQSRKGDRVGIEVEGKMVSIQMTELLAERTRELTSEQKQENEKYPVVKPHSPTEQFARGVLVLSFLGATPYSRRKCSELSGGPLEDRLNEILAWLQREAEKLQAERARREAENRYWSEQRRQREEEERLRREEAARIKKLGEDMSAWRKAARIRAYVTAVEKAAVCRNGPVNPEDELGRWIVWARKRADSVDPIKR